MNPPAKAMDPLAERLARLSPQQLALLMQRAAANPPAAAATIPRRTGPGPWPLSFAQQRLWFIQQLDPRGTAYNEVRAIRMDGVLNADALQRALDTVVERHEALRTVFVVRDGEPVQEVVAGTCVVMERVDARGLPEEARDGEAARRTRAEQERPFDLAAGPLLRAVLLRLEAERHVLILSMHHVISDGWSRGVIVGEISAAYTAFVRGEEPRLPALPIQYPDYAAWQREQLQGALLDEQLGWWTERLAGAPEVLDLPTDHPRPAAQSFAGGTFAFALPAETAEALRALARAEGATPFILLLAAFKTLLLRYTGQPDLVVGTPVANRGRAETAGLVGFFVNTLALRTDLSGDPSFRQALRRVRDTATEAYAHEELPFERVVEALGGERSLSRTPVFQVMFLLDEQPVRPFHLPGLELGLMEMDTGVSMFDLSLHLESTDDGLAGRLVYATALFDAGTIERMAAHLGELLRGIVADPDAPLSRLPLATAEEHALVDGWNATDRGYPAGVLAPGLFAAQAARTPDAPALVFRGATTTYGALDARANRLAHHLRGLGVGVETRVGVCLERTPELIVALLAVHKAGAAYVPLDPAYPRERLGWMIEDAGARLVLTTSDLADRLPASAGAIRIDAVRDRIDAESAEAPRVSIDPENLSHVIFTSGSTGRPKGVMIRHGSVAVLLHWMRENVSDEERASVLGSTSINFDVSVAEIFGTLCWGGTLVLVENALALPEVADQEIRYASMVPTAAAELLRTGGIPASVRTLFLGGEPLPNDLAQALYETGIVVKVGNLYGPTEDTTYSTYSLVRPGGDRVLVGKPVANTRAHVLDAALRPVPVGVAGELYLAGDGLARGYAARPAMTAERFVPDPFGAAGARMYRVMDRVRWTADGELEYFGRTDFQVKIRGFRIELGEIETALRAHAALQDAVAIVREDVPGERRLVAYLVAAEGAEVPGAAELRAVLKERLPDYMVPSAFVALDALPRTPNGKVDRRALPVPDAAGGDADTFVAPRTPGEARLAAVFAEVLGVERVGVHDDFFVLGGHSLLAMRVVTRLREALGVDVPVRALFEAPTVAELAPRVDALGRAGAAAAGPPLVPVPRDGALPLSFAQQRLWFIQQLDPANTAYNMVGVTRLDGTLDADALQAALDRVVERHEALRTVLVLRHGEPVQQVSAGMRVVLEVDDLAGLPDGARQAEARRRAQAEQGRPFDLATGPLMRAVLLRLAADRHELILSMHHVVSDGWSRGVIVGEISAAYTALVQGQAPHLPALPVQYPDYAVWQRERLRGDVLAEQLGYWRQALAGAPPALPLPTDHPRPPVQSFAGRTYRFALPDGVLEPLRTLARQEGASLFMVLLAAWDALLARHTGQADLVVGTPVANRGQAATEGMVGFFANMLALRVDLSGDPTFRQALRRVRESALGGYAHEELPFERLVEALHGERDLSRNPVFQVVFLLDETPAKAFRLPELALSPVDLDTGTSMFDLMLAVENRGDGLTARLEYATALFNADTIERMAARLGELLRGIAADPDARLSHLPLLPAAERARVEGWNATDRAYPAGVLVHDLFAAQAARTPDAPALVFRGETIAYRELDARANRLANHLRGLGVATETRVGVCLERTPELIVALLAVHKAGGAYVPLDPAYPRERLGYMIEDAAVRWVLTTDGLADRLPPSAEAIRIDAIRERVDAESAGAPRVSVDPQNLSHVIFTSGSTGRPKGVMIRHASTAVLLHWMRENVSDEDRASALASTSINFDVSVAEIFGTLCWGGKLVLVENALALPDVADQQIRYASMVPTAAAELLRSGGIPASLRTLFLGGEALPHELAQGIHGLGTVATVGNLYGPTEDTTYSTFARVANGADRVLVGAPVANTRAYVLDGALHPVPVGVIGELYLAGDGLSRGYAARPGMTAERFIPDPFGAPGSRMYRVMDRIRWTPAGELEYFGRTDFQVKVRGYRIELGEIEAALAAHPAVREAVVTAWDDGTGERRLVAYVTARAEDDAPSPTELRHWAAERLPDYMVPSLFVPLDALPLTPNGKTDRGALPDPGGVRPELDADYVAPRNELEATISAVWREALGVERVGIRDNFFELGGTSVRLATVHRMLGDRLARPITVVDLFRYPTVGGLAEFLGGDVAEAGTRRKGELQDRVEQQRQAREARQQRHRTGRR